MDNWIFGLVVLAFGAMLAYLIDRLKRCPGRPSAERRERLKWLYFWFLGRFPTKKELDEEDEQDKGS